MELPVERLIDLEVWERADEAGNRDKLEEMAVPLASSLYVELGKADSTADAPLAFVRQLMESTRTNLREYAVYIVSELGENAKPLLPLVIRGLTDPASEVRFTAASAALALGTDAIDASLPQILLLLFDADPSIRYMAVESLLQAGRDAFQQAVAVGSFASERKDRGLDRVLARLRVTSLEGADAFRRITSDLSDDDISLRLAALVCALRSGVTAMPVIEGAFNHPDSETRDVAAAFAHMLGESMAPKLIHVLERERDAMVRGSVLFSLARLARTGGVRLDDARPLIFVQLAEMHGSVRYNALDIISGFLPLSSSELSAVVDCLRDDREGVTYIAGQVIEKAASSVPQDAMDDYVRRLFAVALDRSYDASVRSDVLLALGDCSASAVRQALLDHERRLTELISESDEHVVFRTLYLLVRCGVVSEGLVATIREAASRSTSADVHRMAARALALIPRK